MIPAILVGVLLTVVTVVIHGVGTTWWIQRLITHSDSAGSNLQQLRPMRVLCWTATVLLLLHVAEISVWAAVYILLPDVGEVRSFEEAAYFSTVTFASLGYGDLVIEGPPWRLLSAIQAMTGLLVFGWSSALFFAVVQRMWFVAGLE